MTIETLNLHDAVDGVPNNPLPVVIYRQVVPAHIVDAATWLEHRFAANGWPAQWRYIIYNFTHFHAKTHELLGVYAGEALVQLGGQTGPKVILEKGDVVLVPAGVGHKAVESSADFNVVGAYPQGMSADLCRDEPDRLARAQRLIGQVPLPATDPITGRHGGITTLWHHPEQA